MKLSSKKNPIHHTQKIKAWMGQLIEHLREDVGKITEPKAMALFETSAEVLTGLVKAFNDYEKRSEAAWRTEPKASRPKERATRAARR
jgi:predicted house-cleaning noncanonical NTP pyrophosphatase (MazG superfamily)